MNDFSIDGDGNSNSHAQFSIDNGTIKDEDIEHNIEDGSPQDLSPIAQIPIFYRSGASGVWRRKDSDNYPLIYNGTAGYSGILIPYNEWTGSVWQLSEITQNDLILVHYFATNDINYPIIGIQGQNVYTTKAGAREGAYIEIEELSGLPFLEFCPIGSVIYQSKSSYTNTPKAATVSTENGDDYMDFRFDYTLVKKLRNQQ
jgi:hypothetical protein